MGVMSTNKGVIADLVVVGVVSGLIGFAILRCVYFILGRRRFGNLAKILILAPFPAYWLVRLALVTWLLFDKSKAGECDSLSIAHLVEIELVSACSALIIFCILFHYRRIVGARFLWAIGLVCTALMFSAGCLFGLNTNCRALATKCMTRDALAGGAGRSKAEIIALLGEPGRREGPFFLPSWPHEASVGDENWLYEFDDANVLVCFEHGRCFSVQTYDGIQELTYMEWKAATFIHGLLGKSRREVLVLAGEPSYKNIQNDGFITDQKGDRAGVEEIWSYRMGASFLVGLRFRNGKCVDGYLGEIFY